MASHLDIKKLSWAGFLISVGIVYGDIGTSPLYTFKAIIKQTPISSALVLGSVSAIFWTLFFQTTLKYVIVTLKADNRGEGGIFSLYTLIRRYGKWLTIPALLGGSFLIADSIITPPISVASAVEGLRMQYPHIPVIPIVLSILLLLFLIQPFGTTKIGKIFGPAMIVWFTMIGVFDLYALLQNPSVLKAINPLYAWQLIHDYPGGFWLLGGVFLCTTGAEALYSDLGHCGRKNIEISWTYIKICLVLCYFGQAAWMLQHEGTVLGDINSFFAMMPAWMFYPAIAVATVATIIASQALISGTFTLFNEAMRLNFFPKLTVYYPSNIRGQLYIPAVNWALLAACIGVVLYFKESSNMEAAFGLSVTLTMLATTILLNFYLLFVKKINPVFVALFVGTFLIIEGSFLVANLRKFTHGGYVTLLLGLFLFWIMFTWRWAGKIKERALRFVSLKKQVPILAALSEDAEIAKCATHLVYFTNYTKTDKVEENIIRSIYYHQPKRANVYWLLHIEVTDEPYTSAYKTEIIEPDELIRVTYYLGFRVVPHINILFKKVLYELYERGEFTSSGSWKIFYRHNPAGDYRFVVMEAYLSRDNNLPLWKKIPLEIFFVLNKLNVSVEEAYQLEYDLVTTEQVPLVVESANTIKLKRIEENRL